METMRANVFYGVNDIRVAEVPRPQAGVGEAVIRITLTTICGTDLHILRGEYRVKPGLIIGYEPVGIITELGLQDCRHALSGEQGADASSDGDGACGSGGPDTALTHTDTLDDIVAGYDLFGSRRDNVLKIVVRKETFMQSEEFMREVRLHTGLSTNEEARVAVKAVLETLFECLPDLLACEVAARLPDIVRGDEWMSGERVTALGERLSATEFGQRVGWREGIGSAAAFHHAQAVLPLLAAPLGTRLFERVRAELPLEFAAFWEDEVQQAHMHQPVA
jgi:uncharacterized protein (DUF2267 family)